LKVEKELLVPLGAQLQARLGVFLQEVTDVNRQPLELLVESLT
jgi:hypothetical protein